MNDITNPIFWAWRIGGIIVCFTVANGCLRLGDKWSEMPRWFEWLLYGVLYVFGFVGLMLLVVGTIFPLWKYVNPFGAIHNWLGLPEFGYQKPVVNVVVLLLLHLLLMRIEIYRELVGGWIKSIFSSDRRQD